MPAMVNFDDNFIYSPAEYVMIDRIQLSSSIFIYMYIGPMFDPQRTQNQGINQGIIPQI